MAYYSILGMFRSLVNDLAVALLILNLRALWKLMSISRALLIIHWSAFLEGKMLRLQQKQDFFSKPIMTRERNRHKQYVLLYTGTTLTYWTEFSGPEGTHYGTVYRFHFKFYFILKHLKTKVGEIPLGMCRSGIVLNTSTLVNAIIFH